MEKRTRYENAMFYDPSVRVSYDNNFNVEMAHKSSAPPSYRVGRAFSVVYKI